jgi:hypothetical protein
MTAFRIEVPGGGTVGAHRHTPEDGGAWATLVLAHGAGAPHTHPFMVAFARAFASRGIETVTFNFPYMEAGRRLPDRAPVLEACLLAVVAAVRAGAAAAPGSPAPPLFAGGKSMGGRMASHVAARHAEAAGPLAGLVLLGYPLHPPGRPEQRRDAHLPLVTTPMLFVQGTRDAFGTPEELRPVLAPLAGRATVLPVEQGDHSFVVPRGAGRRTAEVHAAIQDAIAAWMRERAATAGRSPRGAASAPAP